MAPPQSVPNYYILLQVDQDASHEQLKAAHRRLILLHHPDKNIGSVEATERTKVLNAAWDVLKDTAKRKAYDQKLAKELSNAATWSPRPKNPPRFPKRSSEPPSATYTTRNDLGRSRWSTSTAGGWVPARAEATDQRHRQEWQLFKNNQENKIRQCRLRIEEIEACVRTLHEELRVAKSMPSSSDLAGGIPFGDHPTVSQTSRADTPHRIINCQAAIKVKTSYLEDHRARLAQLECELWSREEQENLRRNQYHGTDPSYEEQMRQAEEARKQWESGSTFCGEQDAQKPTTMEAYARKARKKFKQKEDEIRGQWARENPDAFDAWGRGVEEDQAAFKAQNKVYEEREQQEEMRKSQWNKETSRAYAAWEAELAEHDRNFKLCHQTTDDRDKDSARTIRKSGQKYPDT